MARNVHTSPAAKPASDPRQYVLPWEQPATRSSPPEVAHEGPGADPDACPADGEYVSPIPEGLPAHESREPTSRTGVPPGPIATSRKLRLRDRVERLLRDRCIPYVNVDEAKRALFASAKLRSFHFVAYGRTGPNWLIFAGAANRRAREDMAEWERVFGEGFIAVFASPSTSEETGVGFRTADRRPLMLDTPASATTRTGAIDGRRGGAQC